MEYKVASKITQEDIEQVGRNYLEHLDTYEPEVQPNSDEPFDDEAYLKASNAFLQTEFGKVLARR